MQTVDSLTLSEKDFLLKTVNKIKTIGIWLNLIICETTSAL